MKLNQDFYSRENVLQISRDLLGCELFTCFNNVITSGIITETEAYAGVTDKASHAYGNRRTSRTEVMFGPPGKAYVYLCYGIHSLFNVVTNKEGVPHAVLIRAIKPILGIDKMLERRKKTFTSKNFTIGPGSVSQALGIHFSNSGTDLQGNTIWIEKRKMDIRDEDIVTGPRVGVDYAGEDAKLPYRFRIFI